MAAKIQLNNFRFSIYIDADGTVTLTDLPPELREVVAALDPSRQGGSIGAALSGPETPPSWQAQTSSGQLANDTEGRGDGA